MLIGVSFLATPVKFQASTLDLPTALEVGRVTFALFSKVEWGLCALLLVSILLSPRPRSLLLSGAAVLALVLLVQALWLLPVLDARIGQIMTGAAVPATGHHLFYIAADSLKLLLLAGLAVAALWPRRASQESARCA